MTAPALPRYCRYCASNEVVTRGRAPDDLAADPAITEGVKWNSPSFYCHGWFATISSRKPTQVDVVFYCGAKVRANCTVKEVIDDPERLLTWPSKDRALLSFKSDADFQARLKSFRRITSQWAAYQKSYAEMA